MIVRKTDTVRYFEGVLTQLACHPQGGSRPSIRVNYSDSRFDLRPLTRWNNGGMPSISRGQVKNSRIPLDGGGELHVLWFQHYVEIHIDRVSASGNPLLHILMDTKALQFAVGGLVTGKFLGLSGKKLALYVLLAGMLGLYSSGPSSIWMLNEHGFWQPVDVHRSPWTAGVSA